MVEHQWNKRETHAQAPTGTVDSTNTVPPEVSYPL